MPDVQMPRLSDSMETGKIIRWLKREGEPVKKGEPLVEIESDKANIEVEAYATGTLSKIVVQEGDSAPIGAVIAQIGGAGAPGTGQPAAPQGQAEAAEPRPAAAAPPLSPPRPQAARPAEHVAQAEAAVAMAAGAQPVQDSGGEQYPQGGADDRTEAGAAAQAALRSLRRTPVQDGDGERVKASPVARRLAEELGVDLRQLQGTGPGGRITREDVEAAQGRRAQPAPATVRPRGPAAPGAPSSARPTEAVEVVELSRMQATVATRLAQSKAAAPHFYVTSEIAMDDAVRFREQFNESVSGDEAISFNDLIIRAVALALTRFPEVNASWADGHIERKRDINIGIAVNLPEGLIVPVLRHADRKTLTEIGIEARALIERARNKKARPEDFQGNTFSVSNLGMFDVDQFTAIINPPDSGILAVGAIVDKPVVRDGQVVVGKRMRVTLSVDHRVFYGVTAAQFLQEVKRLLEHPVALVL
ncbi:MAG TPA: dihydrolipoamide acetyltransferase family protein [Candidatus Limnocylindrales bacterium]|nr:dihydrolipoamide acetyltransferase family protein [Candidatus Limnocylindrales bacterium]